VNISTAFIFTAHVAPVTKEMTWTYTDILNLRPRMTLSFLGSTVSSKLKPLMA
jgi:hypothetical protein